MTWLRQVLKIQLDEELLLRDKAFNTAKNLKYEKYQRGLASIVAKRFDKKTSGRATTLSNKFTIKTDNISNKELAKEFEKAIIRKFKKRRKVHLTFIDNIWGVDIGQW